MKIFLTGATGFIGRGVLIELIKRGHHIRALYRSENKRAGLLLPGIEWIKGSLEDIPSLDRGMEGCDSVIHAAAFAAIWAKNTSDIYRLNLDGTRAIFTLAKKHTIQRIVYISSAGVFGPSGKGITNEESVNGKFYATPYDRAKAMAEHLVNEVVAEGLPVVVVNPTRLYGPGLLNDANSVTVMINRYINGKWRFIPGNGEAIGNYAFSSDVSQGICLALEKGKTGERYILGGENVSYNDFFRILAKESGKSYRMIRIPFPVMMAVSGTLTGIAQVTSIKPPITPGLIRKFTANWNVSCAKAVHELGYRPVPLDEGFRKTLEWLHQNNIHHV